MIPYGEKTYKKVGERHEMFESSVIPYGEKTLLSKSSTPVMFESSVIPYGEKTNVFIYCY